MTNQGRLIRLPVHVQEKLDRLGLEEQWYLGEKGRRPTPEELAAELGISVEALVELQGAEREVLSLDEPAPESDEEEELVYADLVEDQVATAFVQRAEDRQWIDWLLAGVDERSRRVLAWHFGLGLSYETIGKHEGVSRERSGRSCAKLSRKCAGRWFCRAVWRVSVSPACRPDGAGPRGNSS